MTLPYRTVHRISLFSAAALAVLSLFVAIVIYGSGLFLLPVGTLVFGSVYGIVFLTAHSVLSKRMNVLRDLIMASLFAPSAHSRIPVSQQSHDLDTLLDLTKQVQLLNKQEFKRLNQSENFRKEFIGDISHELKTPIFTIQGYLETLADGAIDDSSVNRKFLKKAQNNVNRLITLTQDLTEISRLETGEHKPRKQVVALTAVVRDVLESLSDMAFKHRVELNHEANHKQVFVLADRNQIRQVLFNLVENAIKYNKPNGYVHIKLKFNEPVHNKVIISVIDNGIGIQAKDVPRITERFFRVDKSRSRDQGGTGLGLSIVKHIIESHNEQFMVESNPGNGSTFSFTLDIADQSTGR